LDIAAATRSYEAWLRHQTRVSKPALDWKHQEMRRDAFGFLRATYYRWAQLLPKVCPESARAPAVLAVGDLHLENFGTWRDAEGRLAWGVNDFDEAAPLPYTNDLVRLAASAILAVRGLRLRLTDREACARILGGYEAGLAGGGHPIVLAEDRYWLGDAALKSFLKPRQFWDEKLRRNLKRDAHAVWGARLPRPPPDCRSTLEKALPPGAKLERIAPRIAGLGSLGRQRYVAIAQWKGGKVAREAKAVVPPASDSFRARTPSRAPRYLSRLLAQAIRCPDPFLGVGRDWVVRRLAPDSDKIVLADLPGTAEELALLELMGFEVANVHLGSGGATIRKDLRARGRGWLFRDATRMADRVREPRAR
jgi:hypothetical protein